MTQHSTSKRQAAFRSNYETGVDSEAAVLPGSFQNREIALLFHLLAPGTKGKSVDCSPRHVRSSRPGNGMFEDLLGFTFDRVRQRGRDTVFKDSSAFF